VSPSLGQVMAGCTVLITADRRKHELAAALERRGALVRHAPSLTMIPHADDEQLLARTAELVADPPDVVVVTTGIGFRSWVEAADAHGLADQLLKVLEAARLIARGPKARGAIQAVGLTADWVAESETSAEIADLLLREGVEGLRIAVQQHGAGAEGLDVVLAEAGAEVVSLLVYRWGPPPDPQVLADSIEAAASGEIDAVVFTSAPGAEAWLTAVEEQGRAAPILHLFGSGAMIAAAVGPVTAGPLERRDIHPLIPERGRLGALVRALVAHYEHVETLALATVAGPLQIRSRVAVLDGHLLPLSPSGLELLRLLAARRGEVVTRDDVLAILPGDAATAHAAEVAVARLREAMGRRDIITTAVKRGYRLELA
jgi:uroporphyrinogen-III synthase